MRHRVKHNRLQLRSLVKSCLKRRLQHKEALIWAPLCPAHNLPLRVLIEVEAGAESLLAEGSLEQPFMSSHIPMAVLGGINRIGEVVMLSKIHGSSIGFLTGIQGVLSISNQYNMEHYSDQRQSRQYRGRGRHAAPPGLGRGGPRQAPYGSSGRGRGGRT